MCWLVDKRDGKNPSPIPSLVIMCGTGCVPHGGIQCTGKIPLGRIKHIFFEEVNIKTGPTAAIIKHSFRAFFPLKKKLFSMENFKQVEEERIALKILSTYPRSPHITFFFYLTSSVCVHGVCICVCVLIYTCTHWHQRVGIFFYCSQL